MGYLHHGHECSTPGNWTHPDQHGTDDAPDTIWQCDECGQLWRVRFRSTWNEYERMTPGQTRRFRKARHKGSRPPLVEGRGPAPTGPPPKASA